MDHSDQIEQNLEMLGLDSLDHLSLDQLSKAMAKNLPSGLSDARILNIYTMWLHSRLMAIDVSADDAVLNEITAWHHYLGALGNKDWDIADAFDSWQRGEAAADPTSSRRLNIAREELLRLMPPSSASSESCLDSQESEGSFENMHPDRLRLSRGDCEVIELSDDDEDDVMPKHQNPHQYSGKNGKANLPFLTGSNMLALNDKSRGRASAEGSRKPQLQGTPSPPGYVCNRCGLMGHDIRVCPTNLDATFDKTPPGDYQCHFCKGIGLHYGPLCPKHPDPNSIQRQRRRFAEEVGWTDRYRPERSQGGGRSRQQRADRWSPAPGAGSKQVGDKFRPEYESTDRRASWSRSHEGKRRASRSPSLDGKSRRQQKKQKTWLKKGDHHWVTKPTGPREDLLRREENRMDEGRLSYDDEVDDDPQSPLPESHIFGSPGEGKMDVDGSERPASKNPQGVAAVIEAESLELALSEMIRTESTRTDLLTLINGVEHLAARNPAVVKLFEGRENIFINEALGKTRPRPTDFYELCDEGKQAVEEMDCDSGYEKPATTETEEACPAAVYGLARHFNANGDDNVMSDAGPSAAPTPDVESGLVILAGACHLVEAALPSQTKSEGVGIIVIPNMPDQLDDKLNMEGVTEPAPTEESEEASESRVMSCEVGPLVVSQQNITAFWTSQTHDDTAMEVEEGSAPVSAPAEDAIDADMTGSTTSPGTGERSDLESIRDEISPTANAQTSPCPGLVKETPDSEMANSESSPAAGDPTTPGQIVLETLCSQVSVCEIAAEAESPASHEQVISDEMANPEEAIAELSPAAGIASGENIAADALASETAQPGSMPADQDTTVPCQPVAGEVLDPEDPDVEISSVASAPTPPCQNPDEETFGAESDKAVEPLMDALYAALAERMALVAEPGKDGESPETAQVVSTQGTPDSALVQGAFGEGPCEDDDHQAKAVRALEDDQPMVD